MRLHPAAGEVPRHPARSTANVPDPHPAVARGHQVAEQAKDRAILRHPVDGSGEPLSVEFRERVMRPAQLVGPLVHRRTVAESVGTVDPVVCAIRPMGRVGAVRAVCVPRKVANNEKRR